MEKEKIYIEKIREKIKEIKEKEDIERNRKVDYELEIRKKIEEQFKLKIRARQKVKEEYEPIRNRKKIERIERELFDLTFIDIPHCKIMKNSVKEDIKQIDEKIKQNKGNIIDNINWKYYIMGFFDKWEKDLKKFEDQRKSLRLVKLFKKCDQLKEINRVISYTNRTKKVKYLYNSILTKKELNALKDKYRC